MFLPGMANLGHAICYAILIKVALSDWHLKMNGIDGNQNQTLIFTMRFDSRDSSLILIPWISNHFH